MAEGDALARAHAGLRADPDYQFSFEAVPPPPDLPRLDWLANLLEAVAPVLQWLFWGVVALAVGGILLFIIREVLRSRFPSLRRKARAEAPEPWRPAPDVARELLGEADGLAAQGRYAEAAHLLLLRSVNDIEGRDPRLLRPSLTSRDIAGLPALPDAARRAFGFIAGVVELGLFGGREVGAAAWAQCREAYARFALPDSWSGSAA